MAASTTITMFPRSSTNVSNFPLKLHFMLNDLKADGLDRIASWQPHGLGFIVHKPKEFEEKILPCYFQQTKYTSFQRQLSFYDFRRIVEGVDKGSYYHPKFVRERQELAYEVKRSNIKGSKRKEISKTRAVPPSLNTPFINNIILKHPIRAETKPAFVQYSKPAFINQVALAGLSSSDLQPQSNVGPKISTNNSIISNMRHFRNSSDDRGIGLPTITLCLDATTLHHYAIQGQLLSNLIAEFNSNIKDTVI